jgi:CheY-like chemotaxis protein
MEAILVVDDDDTVRMLVREMLEQHGYNVATVGTALGALELVDDGSRFDLVLVDLNLLGSSGYDLAGTLRERLPDVRVVYMSGFSADGMPRLAFGSAFLQKPFSSQDLLMTIRLVLATS